MRTEIFTRTDASERSATDAEHEAWNLNASAVVRVLGVSSDVVASCAIWAGSLPPIDGKRAGCIGRFECTDDAAATAVLDSACAWLRREGYQLAVGPMDGTTWHRYRFATESSEEPAFPMEPTNPPQWPEFWKHAGFTALATYHSSLNQELTAQDPLLEAASAQARAAGLSLRSLNTSEFERELRAIFELSLNAFANNYLYSPIAWEEFAGMYAGMQGLLDPRLVLLCDDPSQPGALAGYIMAFPNLHEQHLKTPRRTLILKSMAVHSRWRSVRLGTWLIAQAQENARALGMSRAIFALMHDDNHSARIGKHYSRVIRRYTLFVRELAP